MILAFISAQLIGLAHACGTAPDVSFATAGAMAATGAAMPADCPVMADARLSTGAACDAHCVPREQADKGADVRVAALAPLTPLLVQIVQPAIPASMRAAPPLARIASPPLSLLFGRFLV